MASPDKTKIGAYLTKSENEALRVVADELGVSASKAVAMSIMAMYDKVSKGAKVSLPLATKVESTSMPESPITKDEIRELINESIKAAIAHNATMGMSIVEPSKGITDAVTPETLEPTETPQTLAPIEVDPETTNDTEPESVGETWLEPGTYKKKYLGELFGLKDTQLQGLKPWLSSERTTTQSKVIPFCNPEWWEFDSKGKYTYSGPRKLISEQPETTPPVESNPTVEEGTETEKK